MREPCRGAIDRRTTGNVFYRQDLSEPIEPAGSGVSYRIVSERKKLAAAGCIELPAGAPPGRW
jgi:hypothetical protein